MADAAQQQAIAELAREVVAEVAPREVPLFRPLSQAYFKDPQKTLKGGGGADKMLGFGGMSAAGTLMTPIILQSTQTGLASLVSGLVRQADSELQRIQSWLTQAQAKPADIASEAIREPEGEQAGGAEPLAPSQQLLDQVRGVVAQQLLQLNVSADQCDLVASKICAALANGKVAGDALERECPAAREVQQLKIEIDSIKKTKDVEEIVNSEYFSRVCQRAAELRRQTARA